jgi:hypothetical protein
MAHSVRQLQHDVDVSRQVPARGSTSAGGSRGLQQASHTGPSEGPPRRFVHGQGDTERRGMSVKLSAPRQPIGDRYRSGRPVAALTAHPAARAGAGSRGIGGGRRSCDLAGWVARATSRPPALGVVSKSSALLPGRASRAAALISRTGIAQRSSQVNWTMIMSSRGWHALHGLAGLPAALGTGIPRVGGVRTRQFRLQARRSQRTGRSPACPRFCSPFCSPDGPFRRYTLCRGPPTQG